MEPPQIPAGATQLEPSLTLGSFVLQMLAEQSLAPEAAQALATSWAGDTAVLYETDGRWCTDATIAMDNPGAALDLVIMLDAAGIEAGVVAGEADTVDLNNCIPAPS